jgi:hypothetical protein
MSSGRRRGVRAMRLARSKSEMGSNVTLKGIALRRKMGMLLIFAQQRA